MPTLRTLVPLFAVLALVAGCGGDEATPERASARSDVDGLLRSTFTNLDKMKSATVDLKLGIESRGAAAAQGPVAARLQGPFVSQGAGKVPKFSFAATLQSGGATVTGGATWTGEKGFIALQGTQYAVSPLVARQFVASYEQALKTRSKAGSGGLVLGGLGIDFTRWLRNPRNEGAARVGDADTVKITGAADVQRVIADLEKITDRARSLNLPGAGGSVPQRLTPQQRQEAAAAIKALSVSVYTGATDRVLRRLVVNADLKDAASKVDATVLFDVTFTKVGQEQGIAAPQGAKPFGELLKAIDAAGLGDSVLGMSGASGPTPAAPNNVDRYAACIEQAKSDTAKARECAALLSG